MRRIRADLVVVQANLHGEVATKVGIVSLDEVRRSLFLAVHPSEASNRSQNSESTSSSEGSSSVAAMPARGYSR